MKQTVNIHDFHRAFETMDRKENFSYEGRIALFEYLEDLEEGTGEEFELDVIAFCCEFREDTIANILNDYGLEDLDELMDQTMVMFVDDLENYKEYDPEIDGDKLIIISQF